MNRSINDLKRICKELVENGFALEDKNGHFMSLNINKTKEEKMIEKQKEFDAKVFGSNAKILRNQAAQFDVYSASIRKLADDLELCVVYILELEEKLKNANENNDKEYQAFLAFKAALGH